MRCWSTIIVTLVLQGCSVADPPIAQAQTAVAPVEVRCTSWELWQSYAATFIQDDGRVVDRTADQRSTSEGQSYALLFALIAGDRTRFDRILDWTTRELSQGDLSQHLPAWHWGRREDGRQGVIDANSASDADQWLGYTLLEAARIWKAPRLGVLARHVANNIARREVKVTKQLGAVLLPGPDGFVLDDGAVRLNPSYLVLPILRRFVAAGVPGPWQALIQSSSSVLLGSAPRGFAPDWITYSDAQGFVDDAKSGPFGSYDAVRVYLWAALLPQAEPRRLELSHSAAELTDLVNRLGRMPERIQVHSAEVSTTDGPAGFVAVAAACAHAMGNGYLATELLDRLERTRHQGLYGDPAAYYDQNLAMFALGFIEKRYELTADGRLLLAWNTDACRNR